MKSAAIARIVTAGAVMANFRAMLPLFSPAKRYAQAKIF